MSFETFLQSYRNKHIITVDIIPILQGEKTELLGTLNIN